MSLTIAVLTKQIPDPTAPPHLDADNRYAREGKIVLDDADLYGTEVALQLIEQAGGGEVTVISMTPDGETAGVRTALAMGADKGIVISDAALAGAHALATAKVINAAIEKIGNVDLVITGTESTDGYTGTLPAQIAALRDASALTFATAVSIAGTTVTIRRQSNEGFDDIESALPAVVSVTAGVVEPRYPNFKGIMAAKSKPVDVVTLSDLGIDPGQLHIDEQKVVSVHDAPGRSSGEKITDVDVAADKIIEFLESAGVI